jgi:hypothetical protein
MKKITIEYDTLKSLVDQKLCKSEIARRLSVYITVLNKELIRHGLKTSYTKKHTQQTKDQLSIKRKIYLSNNPDKHPWRSSDKFKSVPCEKLKQFLTNQGLKFEEEYQPLIDSGKNYSIDVAFPSKKIGIEVNGNQHYNRDGTLKDYYRKRKCEIESIGWKQYDLHYSICYKLDTLSTLISDILNSPDIYVHIPRPKIMVKKSKVKAPIGWRNKPRPEKRKVFVRPTKDELDKLLSNSSYVSVGKLYGVSDNAIRKWEKNYNRDKY